VFSNALFFVINLLLGWQNKAFDFEQHKISIKQEPEPYNRNTEYNSHKKEVFYSFDFLGSGSYAFPAVSTPGFPGGALALLPPNLLVTMRTTL
jgi:hypothetical protein